MKIAVAQSRPIVGPVEANLAGHLSLIELATRHGASLIVFPELSLTGYEPRMAAALARSPNESCFECLQAAADQSGISIAVGLPTHGQQLPRISTLIFRQKLGMQIYSKQHLHADEEANFEPGTNSTCHIHFDPLVALAICYELSVPSHAEHAVESGATVYVASVAKTARGVDKASRRLSEIARRHSIPVMMANCLGRLDGAECIGRSAAWNRNGERLMQLDETRESIIVIDHETVDSCVATLPGASS